MKRAALVATFLSLIACQDGPPVAPVASVSLQQAGAPTARSNTWSPVNDIIASTCTGEALLVTGKIHVASTTWSDSDRLRIQTHVNVNASARGLTSGLPYRFLQISNQKYEMTLSTGSAEANQVFVFKVIAATSAPDFTTTMNGTLRYGADGSVTIVPKKWEALCR